MLGISEPQGNMFICELFANLSEHVLAKVTGSKFVVDVAVAKGKGECLQLLTGRQGGRDLES